MRIEPGKIERLDVDFGEPLDIESLYQDAHQKLESMRDAGTISLDDEERIDCDLVELDERSLETVVAVAKVFHGLLQDAGVEFQGIRLHLVHGTYSNLDWHCDSIGSFRFLLNIGEPTSVRIATLWDPTQFDPGWPSSVVCPVQSREEKLFSGDVYVVNNLVSRPDILTPHCTPEQSGRIVLSATFYPVDGWDNLLQDEDGVSIII